MSIMIDIPNIQKSNLQNLHSFPQGIDMCMPHPEAHSLSYKLSKQHSIEQGLLVSQLYIQCMDLDMVRIQMKWNLQTFHWLSIAEDIQYPQDNNYLHRLNIKFLMYRFHMEKHSLNIHMSLRLDKPQLDTIRHKFCQTYKIQDRIQSHMKSFANNRVPHIIDNQLMMSIFGNFQQYRFQRQSSTLKPLYLLWLIIY